METLTRLVTESLARHGFDRPIDYRRLHWSHWFRCESHHSLLVVPSKPGVFALAEEVMDLDASKIDVESKTGAETRAGVAMGPSPVPRTRSEAEASGPAPEVDSAHRMLAVAKFFEDDDMAFVLDRMLSHQHPMRARLASGRYFVRFVVIEDPSQRRSVCSALNQWIASSAEKATGIGSHFATSLELTPESPNAGRAPTPTIAETARNPKRCDQTKPTTAPRLNSAVPTTIHCSSSFPSGF
ncbi:MAG TPA: hypothetical protein VMS18_18310 [Candidatus Binatia bacterium]|nr:hypothetical protein [Candidatus Binatia bacterium]